MNSEFRLGRALVRAELNTVVVSGKATRVEPKVMEVLVYLARRPGEVVGRETLIRDLWGDTFVTDAALTRCIAELRKVFDDDVREPRVIQTIAKSGYRLIAPVEAANDGDQAAQVFAPAEGEKAPAKERPRSRVLVPALLLAVGLTVGAAVMFVALRPLPSKPQPVLRTALPLPGESLVIDGGAVAMTPDGSWVAYLGMQSGNSRLFLRALDSASVTPVPESDGASNPFFSADSRWIGFCADGKLKKALLSNLSVVPICDAQYVNGASWGSTGTIVFASGGKLYRVPHSGGQPELLAAHNPEARYWYFSPEILPSGDIVLAAVNQLPGLGEIVALPLSGGRPKRVLQDGDSPRYVPTGHLIYTRSDRLMAAAFDPIRVEVIGPSVVISEVHSPALDGNKFAFSASGILLYVSGVPFPVSAWSGWTEPELRGRSVR